MIKLMASETQRGRLRAGDAGRVTEVLLFLCSLGFTISGVMFVYVTFFFFIQPQK